MGGNHGCTDGEDSEIEYTLKVYTPPRPLLPQLFDSNKHTNFQLADLAAMKTKIIKLSCHDFPDQLKCKHVKTTAYACYEGCYVLEKGCPQLTLGGKPCLQHCQNKDCQRHTYFGKVVATNQGVVCFGEKGNRVVCIEEDNKLLTDMDD